VSTQLGNRLEQRTSWRELVRVEATLAKVDPSKIDLGPGFSSKRPFYERQIKSFERTARDQAQARDVDTNEEVGIMPGFEEALAYLKKTLPQGIHDKGIMHGDLKVWSSFRLSLHRTQVDSAAG
jgi:aminoglycoside phosphotransferase (APT) family kinase protein